MHAFMSTVDEVLVNGRFTYWPYNPVSEAQTMLECRNPIQDLCTCNERNKIEMKRKKNTKQSKRNASCISSKYWKSENISLIKQFYTSLS